MHDSQAFGGPDHKTSLHQTPPLAAKGGVWGGLSSWEENGVRYVAAPIWGPVHADLKAPINNGSAPNGALVVFKVEDQSGRPVLTPAWVSRDLISPVPPVITSGTVFVLSTGGKSGRAVLYALDAATGKEVYSTGTQVTGPATLTGLTVANGRVFFTTTDNTLYGFGIFLEI
jgi:outer membrane protein assembly factor BamB